MDVNEIWKPIEGYEDLYEVSNMGRVRRKDGRIRIPQDNGNGYFVVYLYRHSKGKKFFVHRLVAKAFVSNPRNVDVVNHLDENPQNNRADNLEWCTQKENMNYGTAKSRMGDGIKSYWQTHPYHNCKPVRCIETGIVYKGFKYAAEATGALPTNIKKCIRGKRHTAGGYHWEFA